MAYMSALPYAYNDPLPSLHLPSSANFTGETSPLSLAPDSTNPPSTTDPSASMGPPPIPANCRDTSRPSHNRRTNTVSSQTYIEGAKRSSGLKPISNHQIEYYKESPDDSGVVYAIFLNLVHSEVTDNTFPHISDERLKELLARAKTIYHNDPTNTKNPGMLLLCIRPSLSFNLYSGWVSRWHTNNGDEQTVSKPLE
jgi:hypothetical protein